MADTITIRQDAEGRYCLNDLHKAAGEYSKHQPAFFLRRAETAALITELSSADSQTLEPVNRVVGKGKVQGTYVVKEMVYAYAFWISPAFQIKVTRAYDRLATQGVAVHENAAEDLLKNPLKYLEAIIGQAKGTMNGPGEESPDPPQQGERLHQKHEQCHQGLQNLGELRSGDSHRQRKLQHGYPRDGATAEAPATAIRRTLVGGYEVFSRFSSGNDLPLLTTHHEVASLAGMPIRNLGQGVSLRR